MVLLCFDLPRQRANPDLVPGRTTTTLDIKTVDGTRTTSTRTQSVCDTIHGCRVNDDDWETTTTMSCTRNAKRGVATADASSTPPPEPLVQARAGGSNCETDNIIIYLRKNKIEENLSELLDTPIDRNDPSKTWRGQSKVMGVGPESHFVAFIYMRDIERKTWQRWLGDNSRLVSEWQHRSKTHAPPTCLARTLT